MNFDPTSRTRRLQLEQYRLIDGVPFSLKFSSNKGSPNTLRFLTAGIALLQRERLLKKVSTYDSSVARIGY